MTMMIMVMMVLKIMMEEKGGGGGGGGGERGITAAAQVEDMSQLLEHGEDLYK